MGLLRWVGERHQCGFDVLTSGSDGQREFGGDRISTLVDSVLQDSIARIASDVHIELWAHEVVVRYSVNGVLQHACRFAKSSWLRVRAC